MHCSDQVDLTGYIHSVYVKFDVWLQLNYVGVVNNAG